MNEFIKKEEKTYVIDVDSEGTNISISAESLDTDKVEKANDSELPKKIEVVTGNGKDLDISDVSEYLEVEKPKEEVKKENIIIPEEKK